jgi:hypothetical protein
MSKFVKVFALALLACTAVIPMTGCGVGTTVADSNRAIGRVWDYDARMLVDDLGELVLAERPFHGSRYPIK